MKSKFIFIVISIIAFSCKKDPVDSVSISSADFKINKSTLYMNEIVNIMALDSTGNLNYHYDFGDGNVTVGGYNILHTYIKGGTFNISVSIYGKTATKEVRVHPGVLGYQIKNASKKELNIQSYLNNTFSGNVVRNDYRSGQLSDTIYAINATYFPGSTHILGYSLFIRNTEYIPYHSTFIEAGKHSLLLITDSTEVVLPVSYGTPPPIRFVKDL